MKEWSPITNCVSVCISVSVLNTSFCHRAGEGIKCLPNNKILDLSKLKAFADDKINVTKKQKFSLEWVESIVVNGENACYQHFLLFPTMFSKGFFLTHYQTSNFRLFQTERVCRRQFQI